MSPTWLFCMHDVVNICAAPGLEVAGVGGFAGLRRLRTMANDGHGAALRLLQLWFFLHSSEQKALRVLDLPRAMQISNSHPRGTSTRFVWPERSH